MRFRVSTRPADPDALRIVMLADLFVVVFVAAVHAPDSAEAGAREGSARAGGVTV